MKQKYELLEQRQKHLEAMIHQNHFENNITAIGNNGTIGNNNNNNFVQNDTKR